MPQRRSPLLAFLLAVALVAYPVTMPLAMAHDVPAPHGMAGGMHHGGAHGPASHHHGISTCCAGVCGSCPVVAITAGVSPRIRTATRVITGIRDLPAPFERSALTRLPYAIGPPAHLA